MWNPFKKAEPGKFDVFDVVLRGDTGEVQSLTRGHNLAPQHEGPGPKEFECDADQAPKGISGLRAWIEERGGEIMSVGSDFGKPLVGTPDAYLVFSTPSGKPAYGYMVRVPLEG